LTDQPKDIRPGEELDTGRLAQYLRQTLHDDQPLAVKQFPSGFSNLTYLVRWGSREMVLRRPPFGANVKSGHDMEREYRVLTALRTAYDKVPRPVAYTDDPAVLGCPFYLMERVNGVILRGSAKNPDLRPDTMRRLSEILVDNLTALHAIDLEKTGLNQMGKPEGYVQRQVEGWIRRYQNAQTDEVPAMTRVADWLAANRPPERYVSFIHNDYKYDNVVFDESLQHIVAVLDWEMATVGDPLMDLGTTLGYWSEPGDSPLMQTFNLTHLPGNLTRAEVVARYAEKSGRDVKDALFYFVFGTYKIGVIIQQIYYRYRKGLTQDPRFAMLGEALKACAQTAEKSIMSDEL
jgi:aminoglycoside phosphotransferase (APT) family kinase protein